MFNVKIAPFVVGAAALLFWLAFIPFVFIKAIVMRKFFKTEKFKKLLLINAASNALSTFIGLLPTIIVIRTLIFYLFTTTEALRNPDQIVLLFFGIVVLFLICRLFYIISVWIEQWVLTRWLGKEYDQETISQAVKSANKVSYKFFFVVWILIWYLYVSMTYAR